MLSRIVNPLRTESDTIPDQVGECEHTEQRVPKTFTTHVSQITSEFGRILPYKELHMIPRHYVVYREIAIREARHLY